MATHFELHRLGAVAVALAAALVVAGCGGVQIKAEDHVPVPLVDELPVRAGVYYSPEFRAFAHKEERWSTSWEVALGGAHVTKLDRLLHAMFPRLVDVADLAKPPQPALDLILEPRFEEYSFVTPRDAGAEYYAVTIRYRLNLYDGEARLLDSLVYTGYGNTAAGGLSTEKPLLIATERAMRDAGAKFATEFAEQTTVQKLLRGEKPEPLPSSGVASSDASGGAIGEVGPPTGPPGTAAAPAPAPAPSGAPSAEPSGSSGTPSAAPSAEDSAAPTAPPGPPAGAVESTSSSEPATEATPPPPTDDAPAPPSEPPAP